MNEWMMRRYISQTVSGLAVDRPEVQTQTELLDAFPNLFWLAWPRFTRFFFQPDLILVLDYQIPPWGYWRFCSSQVNVPRSCHRSHGLMIIFFSHHTPLSWESDCSFSPVPCGNAVSKTPGGGTCQPVWGRHPLGATSPPLPPRTWTAVRGCVWGQRGPGSCQSLSRPAATMVMGEIGKTQSLLNLGIFHRK